VLATVTVARQAIADQDLPVEIELAGGIKRDNAGQAFAAGVDILVAGSAIFEATDQAGAAREIRDAALAA
jgi:ribulose-phosphate 3-epimerase